MLRGALDRGVNLFDTAPWYGDGHSERLIGKAIAGRRDQALIATKVGIYLHEGRYSSDYSGDFVRRRVGDSLERLGTDTIDIYQLHSPTPEQFQPDGLQALLDLKAAGVIRAVGISLPASIEESLRFYIPLLRQWPVDVVQVPYNLLKFQAGEQLLPELAALGIGVICREPFYFGYLTGRFDQNTQFPVPERRPLDLAARAPSGPGAPREPFDFLTDRLGSTMAQASLAFCLSHSAVATVIPGAMTEAELDEDVSAAGYAPLATDLAAEVARRQIELGPAV